MDMLSKLIYINREEEAKKTLRTLIYRGFDDLSKTKSTLLVQTTTVVQTNIQTIQTRVQTTSICCIDYHHRDDCRRDLNEKKMKSS